MASHEVILKDLLKPISQANPCGDNCRHSDQFICIKDEVRKLEHVNSHGGVHWTTVVKHATHYLSTQSKDSIVAAYLTVGWSHVYGFEGLSQALLFVTQLLKEFGTKLHPEGKPNLHIRAYSWMAKHLFVYCQQQEITASKIKLLKDIKIRADKLDAVIETTFGTDVLSKFAHYIDTLLQQYDITQAHLLAKQKEKTVKVPENGTDSIDLSYEQITQHASGFETEELSVTEQMLKFSENLRVQDLFDLQAYIFSRTALWQDMQYVAERLAEDNLYIPAPKHTFIKQIEVLEHAQLDNDDFANLESIAIANPYWLDVHFLVAQKSVALSGENKVSNLILGWLQQMLRSFPAFSQLKFEDGSSSISIKTLNALQVIPDSVKSVEEDEFSKEINKLANLSAKAAQTRIEKIQKDLNNVSSARVRLQVNLKLVSVLPGTPISNYLALYLKQIESDFHHFHLEEWDPELAVNVLTTLYKVNKGLGSQANNEQIQFALAKLMILDHTRFTELESYAKAG